jgi:hypothetical protein
MSSKSQSMGNFFKLASLESTATFLKLSEHRWWFFKSYIGTHLQVQKVSAVQQSIPEVAVHQMHDMSSKSQSMGNLFLLTSLQSTATFPKLQNTEKKKDEKEKWAVACGHTAGDTMA